MRIVKLNQRYVLGQHGFTHALRFPRRNPKADSIRSYLSEHAGDPWSRYIGRFNDPANWGYHKSPKRSRPTYWIGVKDEALLTAAILSAGLVE